MSNVLEQIMDNAMGLTVSERAKLAHALIASIDEVEDSDVASAWDVELQKRVRDIRENKVKGVPAEDVFARIKDKYH